MKWDKTVERVMKNEKKQEEREREIGGRGKIEIREENNWVNER